jgi:hypothetical protein
LRNDLRAAVIALSLRAHWILCFVFCDGELQ